MPFLQETARSLRTYLVLVGVVGTVANMAGVLSPDAGSVGRLLSLVGVAISLAYAWLGIAFKSFISTNPRRFEQILIAGAIYSILIAVIVVVVYPGAAETGGAVARGIVGLLITLYLLKNVRRLARESRAPTP